jgi:phosphomannomutase / phosphoglucomutase
MPQQGIHLDVFKECDVRGEIPDQMTEDLAYKFGRAIGTLADQQKVVIGGDFRVSTPMLMEALKRGLVESGVTVYDLGQLSTPAYYFGKRHLGVKTGVMVTASHNPPIWNGFKPTIGDMPVTPQEVEHMRDVVLREEFASGQGHIERVDIKGSYVDWLAKRFAGLGTNLDRVVFDCGCGATGFVIRDVIEALGLKAEVLFGEPDGNFPHRSPDISRPGDLDALEAEVKKQGAQFGFGFDGDGDRVGVVDEHGNRVSSDQLIAWLAGEHIKRENGGTVIYDLKLSRAVPEVVESSGGRAIAQKSGHTFIKTLMLQEDAVFGGEYSGHLFFRELDSGDDGLFAALMIASLAVEIGKPFSQIIAEMPMYYSTPDVRIRFTDAKEPVIQQAALNAEKQGAKLIRVDGVRAEYAEGWALMRASVTEPAFTFRFEGNTRDDLLAVTKRFLEGISEIADPIWAQVVKYSGGNGKH